MQTVNTQTLQHAELPLLPTCSDTHTGLFRKTWLLDPADQRIECFRSVYDACDVTCLVMASDQERMIRVTHYDATLVNIH